MSWGGRSILVENHQYSPYKLVYQAKSRVQSMGLEKTSQSKFTRVLFHCQGNRGSSKLMNTDCECRTQSGNLDLFDLNARTFHHKSYFINGSNWYIFAQHQPQSVPRAQLLIVLTKHQQADSHGLGARQGGSFGMASCCQKTRLLPHHQDIRNRQKPA